LGFSRKVERGQQKDGIQKGRRKKIKSAVLAKTAFVEEGRKDW